MVSIYTSGRGIILNPASVVDNFIGRFASAEIERQFLAVPDQMLRRSGVRFSPECPSCLYNPASASEVR